MVNKTSKRRARMQACFTYHFKACGQFEQQPAVFVHVASREVEERRQEVGHGGVLLAALRQLLQQLGTLPKEIPSKKKTPSL